MTPSTPILNVSGLSVCLSGTTIIHNVEFSLLHQEIIAVLGPNGAGKSTLLNAIAGVIPSTFQSISLSGTELGDTHRDRRSRAGIAFLPQGGQVFPHFTVRDNIALACHHLGRHARSSLTSTVLSRFSLLEARSNSRAAILSSGQRQRLSLAMAVASHPVLLLLDEPFANLDGDGCDSLWEELLNLRRSGISILFAEQNVGLALRAADRIIVLREGRISWCGAAAPQLNTTILEHFKPDRQTT